MIVEQNVPLQGHNSFGIVAKARALVRVRSAADVQAVLADAALRDVPKFVLGGGSNIVLTGDVRQCAFRYRDSVFKHFAAKEGDFGLGGRALILRVRFRIPKPWKAVLGYLDLERKMHDTGIREPSARQIFDWICAIRSNKLPD